MPVAILDVHARFLQGHAFALQQFALQRSIRLTDQQFSALAYNAMPRYALLEGVAAIALPAALAPPRRRKALASDPYVITRPRGISFTSRYTGSQDIAGTSVD